MTNSTSPAPSAPLIRATPPGRDWTVIITVGLVAGSTVIASFTALAGLGLLAGWTKIFHVFGADIPMSWLVPLSVDAYGVGAARISTGKTRYGAEVRRDAFWHALAAVFASVLGNAVYHLLAAKVIVLGDSAWVLIVAVSVIPPIALGGLVHLLGKIGQGEAPAVPADAPAVPETVATEVRPAPAVPATAPTVLLPSGVAPAPSALSSAALWNELLEDLALPVNGPGPYPPGYAPAPPVPAEAQPNLGAGPEWSAPVPDRSGSGQDPFQIVPPADQRQVSTVPVDVPEPREVFLKARDTFAPGGELAEVPSIQTIKQEINCGQTRAQQVQAYLRELVAENNPTFNAAAYFAQGPLGPVRTRSEVGA